MANGEARHATTPNMECHCTINPKWLNLGCHIRGWLTDSQGNPLQSDIVDLDVGARLYVDFDFSGDLARVICGDWCIQLGLESIGSCCPEKCFSQKIKHDPCRNPGDRYETYFEINRDTLPPGDGDCSCLYEVCVTMQLFDGCTPSRPTPIVAHCCMEYLHTYAA